MCSSQPNQFRFDVFLSFRGKDTRYTFSDHLFHALMRAGLRTFRDDEVERGQVLKPEIENAIIQSRASIVVLSENYANSTWCLDELWLILEQRRKNNHFVFPVFYQVDPSDVRNQRRTFKVEASKWTNNNVNKWKAALTEVANLTGLAVSGYETDFIRKLVETIKRKLDLKLVSTPTHLTGMETRAQVINSWLKYEQSGTNFLAICGMGGGGKTTLAQHVYNSMKQNFESSSFVEEIGKHSKQPYGLIGLQKHLLGDVTGEKSAMISSVSEGTRKIEEILEMKRVLIILDDIDENEQLDAFLGGKVIHAQSKIIITTRLLDIDAWFGSIPWRCWMHKVELLNDHESLELFSWHAFGYKIPMAGFGKLAIQFTQYCAGNPLALKVLGSSLFNGVENLGKRKGLLELWESRLKSLNSMKGDVHSKIQGVLQRSFDSLPYNNDKELFLHIACFLVGQEIEYVVGILEDDFHAKYGIRTLISRCLLTVSHGGRILKMHQLLQDMGRKIVCDESKDPAQRSRVWCSYQAYQLLNKGDGSKNIEGLSLDILKIKKGTKHSLSAIETGSLAKMEKLKLLELKHVKLTGTYKNFPELRWLSWKGCHLKRIPDGLLTSSLVALNMSFGKLEKFKPPKALYSLKYLNLRYSRKLVSICGFSQLPKLQTLLLGFCCSLTHVCKTIGELKSLEKLQLEGCTKLLKGSLNTKDVNQLERLKTLFICGGIQEQRLLSLPESLKIFSLSRCGLEHNNDVLMVFHAQSFIMMDLQYNLFEHLPHSIDLKGLHGLDLSSCPNLKSLPCLPSTLQELYIVWCTSLERITFQSARFSLQTFVYEGCFKLCEIQGLFKLVSIAKIDKKDLGHMGWIKVYQNHKVDLVGDSITKGKSWHIQMLYEYGIRSTYLQGIKDESMRTYEYKSSSDFLSFHVPLLPEKCRIRGLNTCIFYRSSFKVKDMWILFAIIRNKTKGLAWAYNPVVYCKPKVEEDVVWLSYWPIGNILDEGDEVVLEIAGEKGLVVSGCGASLMYIQDGEVDQKEISENYTREEEVIGGNLSEFKVTTGGYYLCRRDFYNSITLYWLKCLFGDDISYSDSLRWRKSRHSISTIYPDAKFSKGFYWKKIEVGVSLSSKSDIDKIVMALSHIKDVDTVSAHKEIGRLYVHGKVDAEDVADCVEKFEMVKILNIRYA